MRSLLFTAFLLCSIGSAQERAPQLTYGTVFRYTSWGGCYVASGQDIYGKRVFEIEYSLRSGEKIRPSLKASDIERIEFLMALMRDLSFSLPYKTGVYVADGEQIRIELRAGSYNLTYDDGYKRARKQPAVSELVNLLLQLQPKASSKIQNP